MSDVGYRRHEADVDAHLCIYITADIPLVFSAQVLHNLKKGMRRPSGS
jgi:hypothetical protein